MFQQQSQNVDTNTLIAAAEALGHLVSCRGDAFTVDFVHFEVTRALVCLFVSSRRLVASLVLKELAENAPVLFYSHVSTFFDRVAAVLIDKDEVIRSCDGVTLRHV